MKTLFLFAICLLGFPPLESGGSGGVVTKDKKAVPFDLTIVSAVDPKTGDLVYTLTATKIPLVIAHPKTKVHPSLPRLRLAGLEEHLKATVVITGTVIIVVPVGNRAIEERRSQIEITVDDDLVFGGGARIYVVTTKQRK